MGKDVAKGFVHLQEHDCGGLKLASPDLIGTFVQQGLSFLFRQFIRPKIEHLSPRVAGRNLKRFP